MKTSNKLFYCTFFDNRNQQTVLRKNGLRLCSLINVDDFPSLLNSGLTILVSHQFPYEEYADDELYDAALLIARGNCRRLLETLK